MQREYLAEVAEIFGVSLNDELQNELSTDKPNLETVKTLLENGADVNTRSDTGDTPLHIAVIERDIEFIEALSNKGADVNARNNYCHNPLYYAMFWKSDEEKGRGVIKFLIANGADVHAKDEWGGNPLHLAARNQKDVEITKLLVSMGADINAQTNDGETPLGIAKKFANTSVVEYLENIGAERGKETERIEDTEQMEISEFVKIYGSNFNVVFEDGDTLLHKVIDEGVENDEYGLFRKNLCISFNDDGGETTIWYRISTIVRFLVSQGANVNAKDHWDRTPLHSLLTGGNWVTNVLFQEDVIERCLEYYVYDAYDDIIKYLYEYAEKEYVEVAKYLVSKGADIHAKDDDGNTPLHLAVWNDPELAIELIDFLVAKGADVNAKNNCDETPLDLAEEKGYTKIVEYLKALA